VEITDAIQDHWEDSYLPDLQLCEELSLFHKGSVVIADNVDFPGAPAYAAYVKAGGQEGAKVKYTTESLASRPISDVPQRRPVSSYACFKLDMQS